MKAELHWYVAQVMTGSEQETARKLTDAGMEALAPVQILPRTASRQMVADPAAWCSPAMYLSARA